MSVTSRPGTLAGLSPSRGGVAYNKGRVRRLLTVHYAFPPQSGERVHVDGGHIVTEEHPLRGVEPVVCGDRYAQECERGACAN